MWPSSTIAPLISTTTLSPNLYKQMNSLSHNWMRNSGLETYRWIETPESSLRRAPGNAALRVPDLLYVGGWAMCRIKRHWSAQTTCSCIRAWPDTKRDFTISDQLSRKPPCALPGILLGVLCWRSWRFPSRIRHRSTRPLERLSTEFAPLQNGPVSDYAIYIVLLLIIESEVAASKAME